ncbi:hypothetical protein MMPV_005180 [Pyropia vietnamensis]
MVADADLSDAFDSLLNVEADAAAAAAAEGAAAAGAAGAAEGAAVGWTAGSDLSKEAFFYAGATALWASMFDGLPPRAQRAVITASAAAVGATIAVATITSSPSGDIPTADVAAAVAAARQPFRTAAALVAAATRSPPCRYPWARRVTDGGADADAF